MRDPGASLVDRVAVKDANPAHAEQPQLGGGGKTGHAAADDRHIKDRIIGRAHQPVLGGQAEPLKVFAQTRFKSGKSLRA